MELLSMKNKLAVWTGISETVFIVLFICLIFWPSMNEFLKGIALSLLFVIRDLINNYLTDIKGNHKVFKFDWENAIKSLYGYVLFSGTLISMGWLSEYTSPLPTSYYSTFTTSTVVFSAILFICLCLSTVSSLLIGDHYLLKMYK